MKSLIQTAAFFVALSIPAYALEPIPGSLTYPSQPRSKLTKTPVGSVFSHQFKDDFGYKVHEKYRVEPDRALTLIYRNKKAN